MHRIPLLRTLLAIAVLTVACSGGEPVASKTPEEIAELEAECMKNLEVETQEDLAAVSECLERARR